MPPTQPDPSARPVAFLARQAGTAAAFGPLIDALERDNVAVLAAAVGDAATSWAERTPFTGEHFKDVMWALSTGARPRVLVTGTSANPTDDALSWRWARQRGVRTIAFVDSWVNYAERFTSSRGGWLKPLPDTIAVIDEVAAQRLIDLGLPAPRITAVGSPAFDGLADRRQALPPRDGALELLFVSQPLAGRGFPAPWDEQRALALCLETLNSMDLGVPVHLTIRLHPAEDPDAHAQLLAEYASSTRVRVSIDARDDRLAAVASSHAVVGIVSLLLLEARWLNRPAISIQPGGEAPCDLIDQHAVPVVHTGATLAETLAQLLASPGDLPPAPAPAEPAWRALLDAHRAESDVG